MPMLSTVVAMESSRHLEGMRDPGCARTLTQFVMKEQTSAIARVSLLTGFARGQTLEGVIRIDSKMLHLGWSAILLQIELATRAGRER